MQHLPRLTIILLTALLAVTLSACAQDVTPPLQTIVKTVERPRPPMPLECHSSGSAKFKGIKKTPGNLTPMEESLHALQSNKSRMHQNDERTLTCECNLAQESKNADDLARLGGLCKVPVVPAPPATS